MFRSGSTWAYNIARVLLLARTPAVSGAYRDDVGAAVAVLDAKIDHCLIKTHRPDEAGRALIRGGGCATICTYRDPLACIASNMETFGAGFEETLAHAAEALALLRFQAMAGGVLFVAYDDIVARPPAVVAAIAQHLGLGGVADDFQRIADHFSRDNVARFTARFKDHMLGKLGAAQAWESDTLFYSGHIRAQPRPPEAVLNGEQIGRAIAHLGGFVDARGALAPDLLQRLEAGRGTLAGRTPSP
jgi:Sulfotransferase domain